VAYNRRKGPDSSSGNVGHPDVVERVVAQLAPFLDCNCERVGEYEEIGSHRGWTPCLCEGVSPLGKQSYRMCAAIPITGSGSIDAGSSGRARARLLFYAGTQRPQPQHTADT
jgi:hypothetical protein